MSLQELYKKIDDRTASIGVIGLGYVGLPLACVFAELGFRVAGVDIKEDRVETINSGRSPIQGEEPGLQDLINSVVGAGKLRATTSYTGLLDADIITINVETPVDERHEPAYHALRAVCRSLGPVLKDGALVVVESTVAPGTVDNLVRPLLEESSSKRPNVDFFLGTCPERVMPGKLLANLRGTNRVCGGGTPETSEVMKHLYSQFVQADVDVADIITAELVKTTENAYRDVQIAFANEVALICEANGADVWVVRELVNKSPYRQMHLPGAGVGGHCIPKDPWLLVHSVVGKDVPLRLIPSARAVNDSMPNHVAELLRDALRSAGRELAGSRVLVMGYAYLEDSDDTRNSPSEVLVSKLREAGVDVVVHDPYVSEYEGDLLSLADGADAAVVMVKHRPYRELSLSDLAGSMRTLVLVDGRRVYTSEEAQAAGFSYRAVGSGCLPPGPR